MELNITTDPKPECYSIAVGGEIDISCASKLRTAIDMAFEQPADEVKLDFGDVSYIDSTGIGVLVGMAQNAQRRRKRFSIVNCQPGVMRVAHLLGVDTEVSISGR
ncbi:anti-anti-sigma factor [Coriobacterium glomerans PW2]|uniref:Anti-sigma factor antagonist n=1 Tax=Coriobacterium glomerans (strain ATCC 49209 / DSM 20642 / JCM 10262 / PW2) TaxID=700015 RepID=F2N8X2_CORGP|nr:STAS domain-containing protein [Coriobacterium glomerans]AEB07572.1 anti-anti-sigma factor [Coriobacterium glomerans PW2]